MRRAVTPVIPPSLFRHFAFATLLLTVTLALLADGESRDTPAPPAVGTAEPAAPSKLAIVNRATPQAPGWWDSGLDSESGAGRSMSELFGGSRSGVLVGHDGIEVPGHSPEYLASLSEEERQMLLGGLQESGMLEPEIRDRRNAALTAASSRRSGAPSGSE